MNHAPVPAPVVALNYLQGYPASTLAQVAQMLQHDKVADWLLQKYPQATRCEPTAPCLSMCRR
jgi:hypothetical protein